MHKSFQQKRPVAAAAVSNSRGANVAAGSRALNGANQTVSNCSSCNGCGCETSGPTADKVCCAPCACKPKKGIKSFRQGIVMTGCGKPPGACGFDPDITCGTDAVAQEIVENFGAPSSKFTFGTWFHYRSIQLQVDPNNSNLLTVLDDPIGYGPTVPVIDPNYQPPTLMYPDFIRKGSALLYESWIDPCTCSWWRLRYDSCGSPIGYERKQYETPADLEQALRELRGYDSDTNNNAAAEACTSFVVAGIPSKVNLAVIGSNPPFIVTQEDFGYQVFVLDTAVGQYYRDPSNVQCTKPFFPTTCCDGAQFTQYYFSGPPKAPGSIIDLREPEGLLVNKICFQFNASTCRWYVCELQDGSDLPDVPVELCILQCCWSGCRTRVGLNKNCPDAIAKPSLCCSSCCP